MNKKRILIVDDEESIRTVLKNSLQKLGPEYQVTTVADGLAAITLLRRQPFDVVVTDYKMAGMDGLELLDAVSKIRPETRVILMTAYGSNTLESQAKRLQAYRYLAKPLEITAFRQVIQEAVGDVAVSQPGLLILSDNRYREALAALTHLREDVGARCIVLTDARGRLIARTGDLTGLNTEEMASLLGGGMATLQEVGRVLDDDPDAIHLAYRESKRECLYAINIGEQILLTLIVDRQAYSSRIGSVWYYAHQAALALRETLGETDFATPSGLFMDEKVDEAFDLELDRLFGE
ncbi:MAG: response regulator [Chloroflexi bacterium]|nr:response regulator [Chloroflexota bacterium]MBP8054649.1 response regulator [Chloroflexota bacterium]